MKIQAIIILSLVATILAAPEVRYRRDDANSTSSSTAQGVDCGSGNSPKGLRGLLGQLGVLLDNLLANVGKLRIKGVTGGNGDLLNLANTLLEVRTLLSTLLGGTTLRSANTPENEDAVASLIRTITKLLDSLLGEGGEKEAACNDKGGILGNLLGGLTDGALGTVLQPVLDIVGLLIVGLTPPAPARG